MCVPGNGCSATSDTAPYQQWKSVNFQNLGGRGEKGGEGEEHMGRSGVVSPQYWLGQPLLLMLANTSRKTTSAAKQHQLPAVRATEGIPRRGSVRT